MTVANELTALLKKYDILAQCSIKRSSNPNEGILYTASNEGVLMFLSSRYGGPMSTEGAHESFIDVCMADSRRPVLYTCKLRVMDSSDPLVAITFDEKAKLRDNGSGSPHFQSRLSKKDLEKIFEMDISEGANYQPVLDKMMDIYTNPHTYSIHARTSFF